MPSISRLFSAALIALASQGCIAADGLGEQESDIKEDAKRAPLVVRVPVRFTRNDPADVGYLFSTSWVPLTDVKKSYANGYSWAAYSFAKADAIQAWAEPDKPGAGYATAWFLIEIPYDTTGKIAYSLARVKMESEFVPTEVTSTAIRTYSPLRARRGSNQPCLSITAAGSMDGKLKSVALPFDDEGFTERDWKVGDVDASGVPISRVIVGSLRFSATCWPENVEGETHVSAGLAGGAGPVSGFLMMDHSSGQTASDWATLYLNLVENEKGQVSVGELFSTSGTILRPHQVEEYDAAVEVFSAEFAAGVEKYVDAYAASLENPWPMY